MTVLRMAAATLFPVALSGLFNLLETKTRFAAMKKTFKQLIIGLSFGALAVLSTRFGVVIGDGVIMNMRDAAPLCAGLIFGAPAGLIAGIIGCGYRAFYGGALTKLACCVSVFLAGVFSGIMRCQLFENSKPNFLSGLGIGTTMEVMHMLLVIVTNINNVARAFSYVEICTLPMVLCGGVSVGLSVFVGSLWDKRENFKSRAKSISYDFGFWLLICVVIAFVVTCGFSQMIICRVTTDEAELFRNVTLYIVAFMEILIYTTLFILIYHMLKTKVVRNLKRVNEDLNAITKGDLDTTVDVRSFKEFSLLSDHVNATVATLKHYIKDAEERIDKELELAREIQLSALPSVFPPYPMRYDFDIYASMEAAKEVGGDFYDFYMLDSSTLVFLVADVSGKGIPASLFMMTAKTLIKGLAESGKGVDEIFTIANQRLCENNEAGMFITSWIGKLDLKTGRLEYANAGHNPPLIRRKNGEFEYIHTKSNLILAGMEDVKYVCRELILNPSDEIFLYTDGVTEATNGKMQLYGEENLKICLDDSKKGSPEDLCSLVRYDVGLFVGDAPQSDDITMLCVRLNALHDTDCLRIVPDLNSYKNVEAFLDKKLKAPGIDMKTRNRMMVVSDEIYSNIVKYSTADEASIKLRREGNVVFIDFIDNGKPFDPTYSPEPDLTLPVEQRGVGGLGIHMVKKMASFVGYKYINECNVLSVGFELEVEPAKLAEG